MKNDTNPKIFDLKTGQALLTTVIFLLFISTAVMVGLSTIALSETRVSRGEKNSLQSFILAEAGLEDVSYRIQNGKQYSSPESLTLDGATTLTTVTSLDAATRQVVSRADVASRVRSVQTVLATTAGASFKYGAQIGDGGLIMENNSQVKGSVYSNGSILGHNSPTITGDALAASTSPLADIPNIGGNARAHSIANTTLSGSATSTTSIVSSTISTNAYADSVSTSIVSGKLYYCSSQSNNTLGSPPAVSSCPASVDLPRLDMPISDAVLDQWKQEAAADRVFNCSGVYEPSNGETLHGKYTCDVEIDGTKIVTLTGALWVSGNFSMANSAQLKLAPSFGSLSSVVIAYNQANRLTSSEIRVSNSAQILGSGQAGSYIMAVSRNNSAETRGNETAIEVGNSSAAAIYYAPHGLIDISNNANLKEVTAWRLHLQNSAMVTYESGLANVQFSSGPSGGFRLKSWTEIAQ